MYLNEVNCVCFDLESLWFQTVKSLAAVWWHGVGETERGGFVHVSFTRHQNQGFGLATLEN